MEPKLPASNHGPEQSPMAYGQGLERAPLPATPENGIDNGAEQFEQRSEAAPTAIMTTTPTLPAPVATIAIPAPSLGVLRNDTLAADTPLVASDDDLIEREWVDKAKKIIIRTKDDPYLREQEVGKLQADYLRKRYGRELGASQ
jgi:hypothetical protein